MSAHVSARDDGGGGAAPRLARPDLRRHRVHVGALRPAPGCWPGRAASPLEPCVQDVSASLAVAMGVAVYVVSRRGAAVQPQRLARSRPGRFRWRAPSASPSGEFWDGVPPGLDSAFPLHSGRVRLDRRVSAGRAEHAGKSAGVVAAGRVHGAAGARASRRRSRARRSIEARWPSPRSFSPPPTCARSCAYVVARIVHRFERAAEARARDRQLRAGGAHRRGRHGRGVAREAPAAGAAGGDQADSHRACSARASGRARRSSRASSARRRTRPRSAPRTRSTSTTSASPKRATSTT